MVALSHLKSLQALELAVRTGSLKEAALALGITQAAAGQRIKALEEYLGVDLLMRGRSGLRPTPELSSALTHLSTAFRELGHVAEILDMQRGHEIHLAADPDFADLWLKPRLDRFRVAYPNIRFAINGEGDAPIRLGHADCEISFGEGREDSSTDNLFRDFVIPIGSPEIVTRILGLDKKNRLEGFPLLHLDYYKNDPAAPDWSRWITANRFRRTAPERGIRFRRIAPVLEAILANAGLTICGLALISELTADGSLSLPFPLSMGTWTDHVYQARFRTDMLVRPQVRRFRDWLVEEAATTDAWLSRLCNQG